MRIMFLQIMKMIIFFIIINKHKYELNNKNNNFDNFIT